MVIKKIHILYLGIALPLACLLFGLSLLTVVSPSTNLLWKLAILSQECGHYLLLPSLGIALVSFRFGVVGKFVSLWALLTCLLFASILVRAEWTGHELVSRFNQSWGVNLVQDSLFKHDVTNNTSETRQNRFTRKTPIHLKELWLGIDIPKSVLEIIPKTFVYKQEDSLKLSLDFYPSPKKQAACIIIIHGGGWNSGARTEMSHMNYFLVNKGYAVATIDYRLAPRYQYPAQIADVESAIEYIHLHAGKLGIDPKKIVLLGRSAGGQLALQAAYLAKAAQSIKGVIAFYAPADMVYGYSHPCKPRVLNSKKMMEEYLGGKDPENHEKFLASSPLESVNAASPPTLLLHGETDVLVSYQHTVNLDSKLKKLGVRHFSVSLPWATHGFDYFFSGPGSQLGLYFIERFLVSVTGE